MSKPVPNPYAAPHTATPLKPPPGAGRASPAKLQWVVGLMIVSEVSYLVSWLVMLFAFTSTHTPTVALGVILLLSAVVWFSTVLLVFLCGSRPLPYFGIIPLLFSINFARNFLLSNGYRPRIVGAHPDSDERAEMDANPSYRPSMTFNRDGSKRKLPSSLTLIVGACLVCLMVALMFLQ